jgi:hypothetical protein
MTQRPVLEGVRIDSGISMLTRWRAKRRGAPTFMRLAEAPLERRGECRRESRLKWGKALGDDDRFLCDCIFVNRTRAGARLRLARQIVLPVTFQLFEDDSDAVFSARVVWRLGSEIGCCVAGAPLRGKAQLVRRMCSRCYAL